MNNSTRLMYSRFALLVTGFIFTFAVYPLTIIWPSGWAWHTGQSHYLTMITGIYATLGISLFIAFRDPLQHGSLIWFTVWSSVDYGGNTSVQAIPNPERIEHHYGEASGMSMAAGVLAWLKVKVLERSNDSQGL